MRLAQIDFFNLKRNLENLQVENEMARGTKPAFRFLTQGDLTLGTIVTVILPYIFVIAGLLLLVYLLYGGFHLIFSAGDPKAAQEAKGKITYALAGFVIVFVAYWLVQLVAQVLGLEGIQTIFSP